MYISGSNLAQDLFIETNEISFGGSPCKLIEFSSSKSKAQCITGAYGDYSTALMNEVGESCRKPPFRYSDELNIMDIYYPETVITTNGKTYSTMSYWKTFDYLNKYTPKVSTIILIIRL